MQIKRAMTSLLVGGLLTAMIPAMALANFSNGPGSSGIVERLESQGFTWFIDEQDELAVLVNVNSVADLCAGISAGSGERLFVRLPGGVTVSLLHDDRVPVLVVPLVRYDPCLDPGAVPVIATGVGNVRGIDNDVEVSGTRTNSFGERLTGKVIDSDGTAWSVLAHYRARFTKAGEFKLSFEDIKLTRRGK